MEATKKLEEATLEIERTLTSMVVDLSERAREMLKVDVAKLSDVKEKGEDESPRKAHIREYGDVINGLRTVQEMLEPTHPLWDKVASDMQLKVDKLPTENDAADTELNHIEVDTDNAVSVGGDSSDESPQTASEPDSKPKESLRETARRWISENLNLPKKDKDGRWEFKKVVDTQTFNKRNQ